MIKVGLVGSAKATKRILHIARKMDNNIEFISFPYTIANEAKDIVLNNDKNIHFWIFAGVISYTIARKAGILKEKMDYIYHSPNDIYFEILQYILIYQHIPQNISIDVLEKNAVDFLKEDETFLEQKINFIPYYLQDDISRENVFNHHYNLWEQGQVDLVITTFYDIKMKLEKKGIPSYWSGPSHIGIFYSLKLMIEKIKMNFYRNLQPGAVIIQLPFNDSPIMYNSINAELQQQLLEARTIIQNYCNQINGCLNEHSKTFFTILSTKGLISTNENILRDMMHYLSDKLEKPVFIGIGYASTPFNAEQNAFNALQDSLKFNRSYLTTISDKEYLEEDEADFEEGDYSIDDTHLKKQLADTSLTPKFYYRICALASYLNWTSFSSKDISRELGMSERNAQRIISELLKAGLIKFLAEEKSGKRGRNTKLYEFVN